MKMKLRLFIVSIILVHSIQIASPLNFVFPANDDSSFTTQYQAVAEETNTEEKSEDTCACKEEKKTEKLSWLFSRSLHDDDQDDCDESGCDDIPSSDKRQ